MQVRKQQLAGVSTQFIFSYHMFPTPQRWSLTIHYTFPVIEAMGKSNHSYSTQCIHYIQIFSIILLRSTLCKSTPGSFSITEYTCCTLCIFSPERAILEYMQSTLCTFSIMKTCTSAHTHWLRTREKQTPYVCGVWHLCTKAGSIGLPLLRKTSTPSRYFQQLAANSVSRLHPTDYQQNKLRPALFCL